MSFRVIDANTRETLPGLPSPCLIEAGGGQAYAEDLGDPGALGGAKPYWRLYVPGQYEPKDGNLTRVRIVHTEDHKVTFQVTVDDGESPLSFEDWWVVDAADAAEARREAEKKLREDLADRYDGTITLTVTRVQPGVSI